MKCGPEQGQPHSCVSNSHQCCGSVIVVSDSLQPHAVHQDSLSFAVSWSLLKLMSIESVMPSNHLILCHPLPSCPQSFPASRLALPIRWSKYWSFSFRISSSNEYSELISFRMDWLDLLEVQGTLQHHSSNASIFQCSAFFLVQLSHPYMTTGKTSY